MAWSCGGNDSLNGASNRLLSLGLLLLSLSLLLPLRSATFSTFVPQPTTELWAHKVCVDSAVHTALVEDGGTTQIFMLAEALSSLQFHMYVVYMTLQSLYCIFISLCTLYFLFEGCIVMCMYRCILSFACLIVIPKRAQHEL